MKILYKKIIIKRGLNVYKGKLLKPQIYLTPRVHYP